MSDEPERIVVVDTSTPLGEELCRLGRAAGYEMTHLSEVGGPSESAPWTAGVRWEQGTLDSPSGWGELLDEHAAAIMIVAERGGEVREAGEQPWGGILEACASAGVRRCVLALPDERQRSPGGRTLGEQLMARAEVFSEAAIWAHLPPIDPAAAPVEEPPESTGDADGCPAVPVGQAAMALLRLAVEEPPDGGGLVECQEVTQLGHAVMIQ